MRRHSAAWWAAPLLLGLALSPAALVQGGDVPAYFDGDLFTVRLAPVDAREAPPERPERVNTLWSCDSCGDGYVSVLNAVAADGADGVWREVCIAFSPGVPVRQLTSDTDVLSAAAAGDITLTATDTLLRSAVMGRGPNKP